GGEDHRLDPRNRDGQRPRHRGRCGRPDRAAADGRGSGCFVGQRRSRCVLEGLVDMFFEPEFWVAVAFVILMVLFGYLGVFKTAMTALDHRAARIKAELDDAARLKQEAAKVLADYKARSATAEREAADIIANAKAEAERIAADAKAKMEDFVARR